MSQPWVSSSRHPLAWKSSPFWDLLGGEDLGSVGTIRLNFKVLNPSENNEMGLRKTLILKQVVLDLGLGFATD